MFKKYLLLFFVSLLPTGVFAEDALYERYELPEGSYGLHSSIQGVFDCGPFTRIYSKNHYASERGDLVEYDYIFMQYYVLGLRNSANLFGYIDDPVKAKDIDNELKVINGLCREAMNLKERNLISYVSSVEFLYKEYLDKEYNLPTRVYSADQLKKDFNICGDNPRPAKAASPPGKKTVPAKSKKKPSFKTTPASGSALIRYDVSLYKYPTFDSAKIKPLQGGIKVSLVARADFWYRVKLADKSEGYVAEKWLNIQN